MALRFLADHCVPSSTFQSLREANHEVLRLKDVLPVESSDTIVITKAQEIDAILLSLNGDFSHIVNYPPKSYKGIVAMQMHNHSSRRFPSFPLITPNTLNWRHLTKTGSL